MSLVLFDQGVPVPLRRYLTGHVVATAYQRGWSRLANGELLRQAEDAGFEIMVTSDQSLRQQQNLTGRKIAIVTLGTNLWPVIAVDPYRAARAVDAATPGSVTFVEYLPPEPAGSVGGGGAPG